VIYRELLTSAFDKIKRSLNNRKQKPIKDSCTSANEQALHDRDLDANKYFPIFKQALDTQATKTVEVTLYYLQKLISHGFITGNCDDMCIYEVPKGRRRLMEAIVESVCNCVHVKDDNVQLQVIKTLLTIVTSFCCEVHDRWLVECFKACYHIHIMSHNLVNQATAKATLTQMMHSVFLKMESQAIDKADESVFTAVSGVLRQMVDDICLFEVKEGQGIAASIRSVPTFPTGDEADPPPVKVANERGIVSGKFGWCVICRQAAELYCTTSFAPICSLQCSNLHLKICEQADKAVRMHSKNELLADAFSIFRNICKLSLKEISEIPAYNLKSKILSLELILSVLDNPGPVFTSRAEFVGVIQTHLCESLLKNSVSLDRTLFALSLSIFVALVNNFKDSLKTEVGLFLEQIFLRIVESENSSYQHKLLVLQVLYRVTLLPKATLEFFLNYDCDIEEKDVFARMIESLAKIAMGRHSKAEIFPPAQDANLRAVALETLTNIVTQQVAWLDSESSSFNRSDSNIPADLEETLITEVSEPVGSDKIEQSKHMKLSLGKAVAKFNISPNSGIRYLISNGYVKEDPTEIATLLRTTPGFSKSMIGDYIGDNKPLNLKVLYEYVDYHSFVGMNLVEALRFFLTSFRLPGESQKVDRMMEKFAEKYCRDNPEAFGSADTCYVLSFAIIMLQTDLNNPSVKNKMSLEAFKRINEGINQGQNLDPNLLEDIYNAIKNAPFKLMEDEAAAIKIVGANTSKQRQDLFEREGELIVKQSQEMFKRQRRTSTYIHANDVDQIRLMFEAIWHPLLACFAVIIEETTDLRELKLCLQGMYACIKIAARFNMTIELESFISSLAKFTSLIYKHNQITEKNLECVKTLLQVAKIEANYLRASWLHILKCLSRLDYLQLIGSSAVHGRSANELELYNSESISSINPSEIDAIFNMSSNLDDEAVIEFVRQLVEVSKEELWSSSPRIFSLQALVSVTSINMDRIRVVWARIWAILKDHFIAAGLHSDSKIAVFCIDSLKQLAIKFLSKDELSNYNFQKDFLAPFEAMMKRSSHPEVREMLVACMHHVVYAKSKQIKSGWHAILEVFAAAGQDTHRSIVACSVDALQKLVMSELQDLEENYPELINAVVACTRSKFEDLALNSLQLLLHIARAASSSLQSHLWFTLLSGLTPRLQDTRISIRAQALHILFELLRLAKFDKEQWKVIYNAVILPIFDDAQDCEDAWIIGTCKEALQGLINLIKEKNEELSFLIAGIIDLLSSLIELSRDVVAKVAIEVLNEFLSKSSEDFSDSDWELLSQKYSNVLRVTSPTELLSVQRNANSLPFNPEACMSKCIIQIYLLSHLNESLATPSSHWKSEQLYSIVQALKDSYELSHEFNRQTELRYFLWKEGFRMNSNSLPELTRQERESLSLYLRQMFFLLKRGMDVQKEIIEIIRAVLNEFSRKEKSSPDLSPQDQAERDREVKSLLTPLISKIILPELTNIAKVGLEELRTELLTLISCNSIEVRAALQTLLEEALA